MYSTGMGPAGAPPGCCHPLRCHQCLGCGCCVEGLPEARHSGQAGQSSAQRMSMLHESLFLENSR